jgi:hypothetical protein
MDLTGNRKHNISFIEEYDRNIRSNSQFSLQK